MRAYRKVDDHYVFRIDGGRLALLGVGAGLVVLLVFLLGVLVGRSLWSARRVPPVPLAATPEPPPAAPRDAPALSFYEDLKKVAPDPGGMQPAPVAPTVSAPPERSPAPAPAPEVQRAPEAPAESDPAPAAAPPVARPSAPPERKVPAPVFTVQVGSFRERGAAAALAERVAAQGVTVKVVEAAFGGRTWYRVQAGAFGSRASAEAHYREHLKSKGIQGFVTTR